MFGDFSIFFVLLIVCAVNLLDFSLYLCFSVFKVLFSVFVSVESFFMVYSVGAPAGLTRMLFSLFISLRMRGSNLLRMGS